MSQAPPQDRYVKIDQINTRFWSLGDRGSTLVLVHGLRGMKDSAFGPILDNLGNIAVPALIVWGEQGPILPVAHAHIAKERIANSQLHILDKCGHVPLQEHPKAFDQLVLDFLAQN
mgnify:CR=1 FL=1